MKTLKFKTNIKCEGCVAKVTPILNEKVGEDNWEVNIQTLEKTLTVVSDDADENTVISAVKEAGFNAERIEAS
jgi:copper chaperone